jgi:putative transposase
MAPQGLPALLGVAIAPSWRPKIGTEIHDLVRRMSKANPLWGAPRIHGELLKLGIKISQATVG